MAKPFKDGVDQGRRVVPSGKTILSGDASTTLPFVLKTTSFYTYFQSKAPKKVLAPSR